MTRTEAKTAISLLVASRPDGLDALRWWFSYRTAADYCDGNTTKDWAYLLLDGFAGIAQLSTDEIAEEALGEEDDDLLDEEDFDDLLAEATEFVTGYRR